MPTLFASLPMVTNIQIFLNVVCFAGVLSVKLYGPGYKKGTLLLFNQNLAYVAFAKYYLLKAFPEN